METKFIRLVRDGIQEAICEVRFESHGIPEIVIGRLTDSPVWSEYEQLRLPTADLPEQLKAADEGMRFSPSYQLAAREHPVNFVRVGANVVSCHRLAPYPGWEEFRPAIEETVSALFAAVKNAKISRIGFRFINALSGERHGIQGASDLNVSMLAGDAEVGTNFVLIYSKELSKAHGVQVTIATPKFVQGPEGPNFDILIDIDVSTPKGTYLSDMTAAMEWIDVAHDGLKEEFFRLIPANVVDKLRG